MTWTIIGSQVNVIFKDISTHLAGVGKQEARFNKEVTPREIRQAPALWSIHANDAPESEIDMAGAGFHKRVQALPAESHFMVNFRKESNVISIGFKITVPVAGYERCLSLWRDFLLRPQPSRYVIALEYDGFRVADAQGDNVTIDEWTKDNLEFRKPIFGRGVTSSFQPNDQS